ncbi:MAG: sigma-70 family RNA polymerase sigma factor [Pseudomonadota bacterium]
MSDDASDTRGVAESGDWSADPADLTALRGQLLRFAVLQLRDADLAEDAVQEALLGALRNRGSFAGRSALRTWVFGILKHKIADLLRQRARVVTESSLTAGDDADGDLLAQLFDRGGHWHPDPAPRPWRDPDDSLEDGRFWQVFQACLEHLPERQARVFMMREFVGLETGEICKAAGVGVTNLHVLLHRARLRLRACLEQHWFAEERR